MKSQSLCRLLDSSIRCVLFAVMAVVFTGCESNPYRTMAPALIRNRTMMAWPLPSGVYCHSASTGASGTLTLTNPPNANPYQLQGEIAFDYQQHQEQGKDFVPTYPTRNRIWGSVKIHGTFAQAAANLYLDCEAVVNGESYDGTFSDWMDRGVPSGSKSFTIHANQAIATVTPTSNPPTATVMVYKNGQVIALARLSL